MRIVRSAAAIAAAFLPCACDDPPAPAAPRALILDAQGVVFAGDDGSYDRLPFGSARATVEAMGAAAYGDGVARRAASDACTAGAMAFTSYGPIQLGFQHDRLVGWTMRGGADVAAEGGIAPGITRARLQRLTGLRMVPEPALRGEFAYRTPAGEIRGVLAGSGPEAPVEALFAGITCTGR
ncbi:hypothetical protein PK98_03785 [Croceibacterium mercuriale]|uniref:Uncharacterized protein n=1 Tax=Croceibacterium mercuriale TaxID=1572751 RepID=A0A0B2C0I3_9SPHN|nr:hypothetical protein [Croceibacterium mercuriale]KHL25752.1 hypothetical protein PK98_03785 [Croceibacterium mercuriale]